ncbi:MAG: nucleotidyltransferase family protein [Nitrospirae bacterium]|nr:nucleotidyltransferase family protein [Nitrospirota bacterium]
MITPEENLLLSLSRIGLSKEEARDVERYLREQSQSFDYRALVDLASANGVTPLLYHNLKAVDFVPPEVMKRLRSDYLFTMKENVRKAGEVVRIVSLLRQAKVETIPLKGPVASDVLFGDPGLYPSGDLDILVKPGDLEKTGTVLLREGYRDSELDRDRLLSGYHINFGNGRDHLEVHWTLAFRYFDIPPEFWWEEAGVMEYEGLRMPALSPERYLLYAVFRLYSHAFRPLRFLVLAAAIIHRYEKEIDWPKVVSSARKCGMERLVLFTLRLLRELLGANVPGGVLKRRLSGYRRLKGLVLSGLFREAKRLHFRMFLFTALLDSPLDTAKVLLRRVFPPLSEVRLRYNLPTRSKKIYAYYLANPLLMVFRKR